MLPIQKSVGKLSKKGVKVTKQKIKFYADKRRKCQTNKTTEGEILY